MSAIEIAEERFVEAPKTTSDEVCVAKNAFARIVPLVLAAKLQLAGRIGQMPPEQFAHWATEIELNTPVGVKLEESARAIADMARVRASPRARATRSSAAHAAMFAIRRGCSAQRSSASPASRFMPRKSQPARN